MNRPMKTLRAISLFLPAVLATSAHAAVLWSQNFNAGGAFSTYVDTTQVTNNKFRGASGYSSFNTASFDLQLTSPTSSFASTYGLAFGTEAGYFQFGFNPVSASTNNQFLQLGVGDYSGAGSNWLTSSAQVTNFGTGSWNIRNTNLGLNSAQSFTGNQTITYVINNSGATFDYDLGSGISGTLANDFYRVYVGSTLLTFGGNASQAAANGTASLQGFRFSGANPGTGTVAVDNITFATIAPVPEPNAILLLGAAGFLALVVRRVGRQKSQTLA